MTLLEHYESTQQRCASRRALCTAEVRWTWADLDRRVQRLAAELTAEGIGPGTRVAVDLDNGAAAVVAIWATLRVGAAFCCLDVQAPGDRWRELLDDLQPHLLLTRSARLRECGEPPDPGRTRVFEEDPEGAFPGVTHIDLEGDPPRERVAVVEIDPESPANLVYTSGSTGRPKAIVMSHRAVHAAASAIAEYLRLDETDVVLDLLPLSFDYGLYQVLLAGCTGAAVVLREGFGYPGTVLNLLREENVTTVPGVPSLFHLLLRHQGFEQAALPDLCRFTNTGGHLDRRAIGRLRQRFPGARIYLMYGLSECKRVSYLEPELVAAHPDSVGRPMRGCEVEIVDAEGHRVDAGQVGELVVRGENLMTGYWRRPEATAEALREGPWPGETCLWTGDLFRRDEAGLLYFVSRGDDVFKSRGEKVAPAEVEAALLAHTSVVAAAVIGLSDEILDTSIHAFVVTETGVEVSAHELRRHCAHHLERRKVPHVVHLVGQLPRTARGKVDRSLLISWARAEPTSAKEESS